MVDIKLVKAELLRTAAKEEPPQSFVQQEDIMDMMLKDYFNPVSHVPKAMTLNAIHMASEMAKEGASITQDEVKAILDKHSAPKP